MSGDKIRKMADMHSPKGLQERGNYLMRTYLSFSQQISLEMLCRADNIIFDLVDTKINFEDPMLV